MENSTDTVNLLSNYGAIGIILSLLIFFARAAYKRETDRGDRLEQEVLRLNSLIQEKYVPALAAATTALTECVSLLNEFRKDKERADFLQKMKDGK